MTPRQWQIATAILIMAGAVVLQFVVLARLPFVAPGLVAAAVIAIGMAGGQTFGALAGFGAGLALDVLPPAQGLVGSSALALVVVGVMSGRVRDPRGLAPLQLFAVAAGLAAVGAAIVTVFTGLLGGALPDARVLATDLIIYTLLTALVALAVVPLVGAALRRVTGARRHRRLHPVTR